jgi:ferredoxin
VLENGNIGYLESVECDWCKQCELVCLTGAVTFPFEVVIDEKINPKP